MTDAEFMAWQHRVITNMAGCTCNLQYRHGSEPQPQCEKCRVVAEYIARVTEEDI
jgi:hypothetical protein